MRWMKMKQLNPLRDQNGVPGGPPVIPPPSQDPAPVGDPPAPAPPAQSEPSFTKEDIANLLAENALLRAQVQQPPTPPQPAAPPAPDKPLNQMNGEELARYLEANTLQPINQTLMDLAVRQEIMDVRDKYGKEFLDLKDEVYNACKANSNLSLEQAFLMVKGAQAVKGVQTQPPTPPVPPAPPAHRPGVPPEAVQPKQDMDTRSAVLKAMKDLNLQLQ